MKKKILAACLVICLLATAVIGTTLAYFTDETDAVTNTFTVGKVDITMDEAKVDEDGVEQGVERTTTGNAYKLVPGHTYVKDPTIHVAEGSEPCYVFVKFENQLAGCEDTSVSMITQMTAKGWKQYEETNVYYQETAVDASSKAQDVVVFESFKVKGDISAEDLGDYASNTVILTAYAVQAEGFGSAAAAWEATFRDTVTPAA